VIFEAMATGLPVISTRVGWHAENCTDELIWADRPMDGDSTPANRQAAIEALATKLVELKNDHAKCKALGARARAFAEQWPHSRIADMWRPILSNITK